MKTRQKLLLTALSAALVVTMTSGLTLTALADEATKDHEFDAKTDVVFEDFDRENISDTVKAEGDHADLGEKPYLHVEYTAGKSATPADAIYKQGSGSLAEVSSGGTIALKMRAPKGDVELSEIKFGVRGVDNDAAVLAKTLDELTDSESEQLPELTTDWQEYKISFATSYEDSDIYPTTQNTTVAGTPLLAIHLYAAEDAAGTLDIASVSYSKTGSDVVMNDFRGGDTVESTAKLADSGTWWAGSSEGYIVKRAVKLTEGGSFTVVKDTAVGDYKYAVIETDGDKEKLKVATTTDGTAWGELAAYDGYSINLTGTEKGFKFTYDGGEEGGVTVKRIYLTDNVTRAPATAVPVIDASSAQALEDFSFAQKGFTGVYEDMSTVEGLADAGLDYRLSYSNGELVEVKDGSLIFDATDLVADGYINFKFKSKGVAEGKYVVLKVKAEDGATLDSLRFALGDPDDKYTDIIWSNQFKSAYGFGTPLLTDANPYRDGDWSYIVIDIEESGFAVSIAGYSGMDLYFGGKGKLYIDTVFFADRLPDVVESFTSDGVVLADPVTGYFYAGGFELNNKYGTATKFSFDITPKAAGFDPSNLRLEMGTGTYWGSENAQGTLITTKGKKLTELTYTKDEATHIEIDVAASGIGTFTYVHVHTSEIGAFTLDNVELTTETPKEDFKELSENVVTLGSAFTAAPTADQTDYTYVGGAPVAYGKYGKLEFTVTPGAGFDGTELRVEIKHDSASVKQIWIAQQGETLITADGKKYSEIAFEEGMPVNFVFDLISLGADEGINQIHVHSAGTKTGPFTLGGVKLTAMADNYAEEVEKLPAYLDTVKPEVHITTAATAKAGDEITIAYTASDDVTAEADLNVTILVVKDGKAVSLEGNKFTAEEGVYTVTVTVRDANGNEAADTLQITVSGQGGNTSGGEQAKGLSAGAIAGIVIGAIAGIALIGIIAYVIVKKKR